MGVNERYGYSIDNPSYKRELFSLVYGSSIKWQQIGDVYGAGKAIETSEPEMQFTSLRR